MHLRLYLTHLWPSRYAAVCELLLTDNVVDTNLTLGKCVFFGGCEQSALTFLQVLPSHGKAYFRAAASLSVLGHHEQAAELLQHASEVDIANTVVRAG